MSINKDIFLHESDKAALDALESLPGFAQVTKAFIKAFNEKMLDVQNMSTNIRITDKQLKKYHDMLIPICKKLDIEVPDLYLTLNVMPNAYTSGDDKPCIVLTSGLLETMPEELIPTVLAHECGHIACHHVLYRTMGQMIFNGSLMLLMGGGLAALLTIPLRSAFAYWMRCSEFSADRAAILCDGSADKLVEMCMRFAGYDKRIADFADPKEFLNQAREYRDIIKDDSSRRSMEFALFRNNSHPNNALRALEADEWAKSEEFSRAKEYMDSLEAGISPRQFMASVNHDELVGKNVDEMKKKMEDLGFSVKLERKSEPNIFYGDNDITDATINGKKDFKDTDWYERGTPITLTYYHPYSDEEDDERHPGTLRLPNPPSYYVGKDIEDIEMELFELGLLNVRSVPLHDLDSEEDERNNKVAAVYIGTNRNFHKGDRISYMEDVRIAYHCV